MIFRFPGGKRKGGIIEKILSKAPKLYSEFREPFVGGGIFWKIDINVPRWINDIDSDLMFVYSALKNRPDDFIKSCREIEPPQEGESLTSSKGGKPLYNARLKKVFDEMVKNKENDPALSYFFINRTVWGGRINYNIPSRLYYSNPQGWNITKTDKLERAAKLLKDCRITNVDYSFLLNTPGENVFIYCDPPYVDVSNLSKSSQLYVHNFTINDHMRLSDNIKLCKHKVLISYDDDKNGIVRSLYQKQDGFNIYEESWIYSGTYRSNDPQNKKRVGNELIITNYLMD